MNTTETKIPSYWKLRMDEWKNKVREQQHFHENISSYLKKVYQKNEKP